MSGAPSIIAAPAPPATISDIAALLEMPFIFCSLLIVVPQCSHITKVRGKGGHDGPTPRQNYSARNAVIGSTEAARRAGRKLANNAEIPNTAATQARVVISQGGVPKSSLRISEAARI